MKYKYTIVTVEDSPSEVMETMEKHARKGWECFSIMRSFDRKFKELYFKRIDLEWELEMIKSRPIGL